MHATVYQLRLSVMPTVRPVAGVPTVRPVAGVPIVPPVVGVPIVRPVIGVPIVAMMTDTVVSSMARRPHEQKQHQAANKPSGSSHGVDSSVMCEVHARREQE